MMWLLCILSDNQSRTDIKVYFLRFLGCFFFIILIYRQSGEYINTHHLPIESGDIFTTGGSNFFILLSQPCELMMRPDGRRSRSFNDGLLIRITNKQDKERFFCTPELEYWKYDSGNRFYVDFREKNIIKLCILDLCVFNSCGKSIFYNNEPCPGKVLPAWQSYYKKHITKNLKKICALYDNIKKCIDLIKDKI